MDNTITINIEVKGYKESKKKIKKLIKLLKKANKEMEKTVFVLEGYSDKSASDFWDKIKESGIVHLT